jgi:hypothetical protein
MIFQPFSYSHGGFEFLQSDFVGVRQPPLIIDIALYAIPSFAFSIIFRKFHYGSLVP